jgi:hypothetical protein
MMYCTLYSLYAMHCTLLAMLHTEQVGVALDGVLATRCALYTVRCALCTVRCALYAVRCTMCTIHYALCAIHYALCTMHYVLYSHTISKLYSHTIRNRPPPQQQPSSHSTVSSPRSC